jgi:DNA-binding transcriptional ArsR family regulator
VPPPLSLATLNWNVTVGAERLDISQPAVSKQVRELERALGVHLFDRVGRRVFLSQAGVILADYARRVFALVREAEQAMAEVRAVGLGADLDSERFEVRSQAGRELERLGEGVVPALRKSLDNKPSPEMRRRAEVLIERLASSAPSGQRLQALRSIEVLEWIGTPQARVLLDELAKGLPEARQTRDAKAALERLANRH